MREDNWDQTLPMFTEVVYIHYLYRYKTTCWYSIFTPDSRHSKGRAFHYLLWWVDSLIWVEKIWSKELNFLANVCILELMVMYYEKSCNHAEGGGTFPV